MMDDFELNASHRLQTHFLIQFNSIYRAETFKVFSNASYFRRAQRAASDATETIQNTDRKQKNNKIKDEENRYDPRREIV